MCSYPFAKLIVMNKINMSGFFVMLTPAGGYVNVNPEFRPELKGISPTGRYHVFYAHPEQGSCTFILEQDEHCKWVSNSKPSFVLQEFIDWIAERIVNN